MIINVFKHLILTSSYPDELLNFFIDKMFLCKV
jgi:hypothetical protein